MLLSSHFTTKRKNKASSCLVFRSPPAITGAKTSSLSGYNASTVRKLSGRRAKHRAPVVIAVVRTSPKIQMQEDEEEEARAVSSTITGSRSNAIGNVFTSLYARASSLPTASLKNETWNDVVVANSSVPINTFACKLAKKIQSVSHISDNCLSMSSETAIKPSIISDSTPRSKIAKHVHFTSKDNEIIYEVTKDDIKNSWLDIDVSRALDATKNESDDTIVIFGSGRLTASNNIDAACKNGKGYMVRIQRSRLINEMLGQRTNLIKSVLEEQARQKREGVVDAEEMYLVASKHSKWAVELAKSSWWLCRT